MKGYQQCTVEPFRWDVRVSLKMGRGMQVLVKDYSEMDFLRDHDLLGADKRILNAGSSSVRYGDNCINVDIQCKENVDIVCDIHELPESLGEFDVVICNAVLQYCHSPKAVAREFYRVLKPGGYLFVDAPWIQPFCFDTSDRFRFSQDELKVIFSSFSVVKIGSSIRSGSAFVMLGIHIAKNMTNNRYINYCMSRVAILSLYPFRWIVTADESQTAGAFYLICKKEA